MNLVDGLVCFPLQVSKEITDAVKHCQKASRTHNKNANFPESSQNSIKKQVFDQIRDIL